MFTPELERTRPTKIAQNKQYYDDLRAQIAEKHRKTESPLPYSTTNQTYASSSFSNGTKRSIVESPPSSPHSNHTYNFNNSMNDSSGYSSSKLLMPYQNPPPPKSYISSTSVLPDFTKTSIAPLNLTITNFQIDTLPDLPRQMTHQNSIDPETFNERLRTLQAQIDEQKNDYIHASDSQDRLKSQQFPDMQQLINELDNILEKTVVAKIPMHLKNIS